MYCIGGGGIVYCCDLIPKLAVVFLCVYIWEKTRTSYAKVATYHRSHIPRSI